LATAEIVSIGSELLLGQIVDTNADWMAQRLTELGVNLYFKTIVGDNPKRMREVIDRALGRSDIVITGGGIGPTRDDLTRETVAQVTGRVLAKDPELAAQIEHRFRRRGLIITQPGTRLFARNRYPRKFYCSGAGSSEGRQPFRGGTGGVPQNYLPLPEKEGGSRGMVRWVTDHNCVRHARQTF
jgi:molybdenum cofactor synthesis domain-containing protein